MGKDLVPRFKCPLCGWLAYYSMLDKGPYKLEIKGMKYDGFQEISYHRVWTGKKEYKEFLRLKVRELAKKLGLKLVDEEEAIDYDEEEIETEPSDIDEEEITDDDLEALGLGLPSSVVTETPAQRMVTTHTENRKISQQIRHGQRNTEGLKEFVKAYKAYTERSASIDSVRSAVTEEDSRITITDAEFVDGRWK